MHDTFLNERIYEELLKICNENKILKINKIHIEVNKDSHVFEDSVRQLLRERSNNLIDDLTEIIVEKLDVGKLNAIIKSIEGEASDD